MNTHGWNPPSQFRSQNPPDSMLGRFYSTNDPGAFAPAAEHPEPDSPFDMPSMPSQAGRGLPTVAPATILPTMRSWEPPAPGVDSVSHTKIQPAFSQYTTPSQRRGRKTTPPF